jgi:hypothetical protein
MSYSLFTSPDTQERPDEKYTQNNTASGKENEGIQPERQKVNLV